MGIVKFGAVIAGEQCFLQDAYVYLAFKIMDRVLTQCRSGLTQLRLKVPTWKIL